MTIQEAIKSGKRFRRPNSLSLIFVNNKKRLQYALSGGRTSVVLTTDDLLAADWEIESEEGAHNETK